MKNYSLNTLSILTDVDLFATNIYLVTGDLSQFNANEPDVVAKLT